MKKIYAFLLFILAQTGIYAQINVSTGIDNSGAALAIAAADPNWTIVASPYPPGTYPAYVVPPYYNYWQLTPITGTNAGWLNKNTTVSTELPGDYTFERKFTVPASTASFNYSLSVAYDDIFISLELVAPDASVTTLPVATPGTWYYLNTPSVGVVNAPLTGTWRIRAKVNYYDQLGAFMLSGNVRMNPDSSVYCCTGANKVSNGNFEAGNNSINSQYALQPVVAAGSILPGQYAVVNKAQALAVSPAWNVEDHTRCINGANSLFMVVNGRTTQPAGTTRIIWQQTIPVVSGRQYKLCANFKNLPQCTFDSKPQVRLEINGVFGPWTTINMPASPCAWQLLYQCFTASENAANVRIHLKEDANGDGNDLAIDDISVQEKQNPGLSITVQHQGKDQLLTGSVNTISPADDQLLNTACDLKDKYYWFVYEVSSYPALTIAPNSFAWSSNNGGWNNQLPGGAISPGWNLTTTFPGYNFEPNKLYLIGLYMPSCCESCYTEGITYQLTGSFALRGAAPQLTETQKEQIKTLFVRGTVQPSVKGAGKESIVFPNPATEQLYLKTNKAISRLQVIAGNGMVQIEEIPVQQKALDIKQLPAGAYTIKIYFTNGETATEIFIKQ